jgi:hypothetical protein
VPRPQGAAVVSTAVVHGQTDRMREYAAVAFHQILRYALQHGDRMRADSFKNLFPTGLEFLGNAANGTSSSSDRANFLSSPRFTRAKSK